jgi:hypothetical protein
VGLAIVFVLVGGAALIPPLARRRALRRRPPSEFVADRERDLRAERRARELLGSTAGPEVAEMYDQLGFVAIEEAAEGYGYLVYPHRPIVGYATDTGELLNEYCVRFPDAEDPTTGEWLPDADDVLAKWLALTADEAHVLAVANLHLPGRQLDPAMVRRDLATLREWRVSRSQEVAA